MFIDQVVGFVETTLAKFKWGDRVYFIRLSAPFQIAVVSFCF